MFFEVCSPFKEVEMQKHVLVLTTTAAILACGAITTTAQAPGAQTPGPQQSPTTESTPSAPGGMMGRGMMGLGMMGMMGRDGYAHGGWHQGRGSMGMRMVFSLMDADGDGKLTLQEWQAAQERIFKAMDTDHDGTVTFEEMEAFIHGTNKPAPSR
jgi:EF hand